MNQPNKTLPLWQVLLCGAAIVTLTYLGYKDAPNNADPAEWSLMPIFGKTVAEHGTCGTCHRDGGTAAPVSSMKARREPEWLLSHVRDPEIIAPGIRPAPRGGVNAGEAFALLAYAKKVTIGAKPPTVSVETAATADVFGGSCAGCHALDGDGATSGPDLSHVGAKRDAAWLAKWISDPSDVDPKSTMPAFGAILDEDKMATIVKYLAARR